MRLNRSILLEVPPADNLPPVYDENGDKVAPAPSYIKVSCHASQYPLEDVKILFGSIDKGAYRFRLPTSQYKHEVNYVIYNEKRYKVSKTRYEHRFVVLLGVEV